MPEAAVLREVGIAAALQRISLDVNFSLLFIYYNHLFNVMVHDISSISL
jgi:uncharacterized membrane protein